MAPRLAMHQINEAALCTRVRKRHNLSQKGFELANGLPFVPTDVEIHHVLAEPTHGGVVKRRAALLVVPTDRVNRVVSSFLDYARPAHTDPEPIHVNSAVQLTLQFLRPECDAADVGLHVAMDPDLPAIRIDIEHLRQVLINLIQNAMQAMTDGGDIYVETRVQDRFRISGGAGRWVQISVRDTGLGIAPGLLANLFVPFVTTKQQGTGLGLAISHRIVSEAGGRIDVRSREGAGTTFVVLLPAEPEADLESFEAEQEPNQSSESEGPPPVLEPAKP